MPNPSKAATASQSKNSAIVYRVRGDHFEARHLAGFLVLSRARPSLPSLLLFPGNTRLFLRSTVTDQHHPAIQQHPRVARTAQDYELPMPPEQIRKLLEQHPAPPQGSADAI